MTHLRTKVINWVWKLKILTKINFFTLAGIRDLLLTCKFLSTRRLEIPNKCHLCNQNIENIDHVFWKCPLILDRIKYNFPTPIFYEGELISWLEMIYKNYKTNCKLFNCPMKKDWHNHVECMDT